MTSDLADPTSLEFRLLGPMEVRSSGTPLAIGPPKQRTVLAVLITATGRAVSVDRLMDELWSGHPPSSGAVNLRGYAAGLRRALPEPERHRLTTGRQGYRLSADRHELDFAVFEELARDGRTALDRDDPDGADRLLGQALAMWRGAPFEDLPLGAELESVAIRFDELRRTVQEDRFEAQLELGEHGRLVPALRRWVKSNPFRERGWNQLALALYRAGDSSAALEACRQARSVLVEELGLLPGQDLQRLQQSILNRSDSLLVRPAPVTGRLVPLPAPKPRQLPPAPFPFVGRKAEDEFISRALGTGRPAGVPRIVAIHGSSGVGKSALACAAAHRCAGNYPDGQLYVDFGRPAAKAPEQVLGILLRALGEPAGAPDPAEDAARLRSILVDRRVLLVLDDVRSEHQLASVLPAGSGCGVIVTCRRALPGLHHASQLALTALPEDSALELLEHYAGRRRIRSEDRAARAVVRLCGQLPLALRLAGARLAGSPGRPVYSLARQLADDRRTLDELDVDGALRSCLSAAYESAVAPDDALTASAFRQIGLLGRAVFHAGQVADAVGVATGMAAAALDRLAAGRLVDEVGDATYRVRRLERLYAAELAAT